MPTPKQTKTVRTEAQIAAEKRHNRKRRGMPTIPVIRLTEEEAKFVEQVFRRYGRTKKEAVLEGLKLLERRLKNS